MEGGSEIDSKVFEGVIDTLAETNKLLMEVAWVEQEGFVMAGHPKHRKSGHVVNSSHFTGKKKRKRIRRKGKKRR